MNLPLHLKLSREPEKQQTTSLQNLEVGMSMLFYLTTFLLESYGVSRVEPLNFFSLKLYSWL